MRKLGTETAVVMVNLSPHSAFYRHPAYPLSSAGLLTPASADFLDDAAL
ncbi:hypothetical protein P9D51_17830 [Bacillus sonorensis]|nr:hypothetical protein [Bacillus sonorensis]MEC1353724.1 hypothetical protein [Bacillus sonorensis]MEC1427916.1 hypothetical protein [Bacillus sonorensis]